MYDEHGKSPLQTGGTWKSSLYPLLKSYNYRFHYPVHLRRDLLIFTQHTHLSITAIRVLPTTAIARSRTIYSIRQGVSHQTAYVCSCACASSRAAYAYRNNTSRFCVAAYLSSYVSCAWCASIQHPDNSKRVLASACMHASYHNSLPGSRQVHA